MHTQSNPLYLNIENSPFSDVNSKSKPKEKIFLISKITKELEKYNNKIRMR